jgi:hypothetical protein
MHPLRQQERRARMSEVMEPTQPHWSETADSSVLCAPVEKVTIQTRTCPHSADVSDPSRTNPHRVSAVTFLCFPGPITNPWDPDFCFGVLWHSEQTLALCCQRHGMQVVFRNRLIRVDSQRLLVCMVYKQAPSRRMPDQEE